MFSKIFNSVKDLNYVKVTKDNWKKIEDLFAKKDIIIRDQKSALTAQADLIQKQNAELETLRKYKANDDMVYTYEEISKKYENENKALKEELSNLENTIKTMDRKVKSVLGLESTYLRRIIEAENKARYTNCPEYQEVGQGLVELYA